MRTITAPTSLFGAGAWHVDPARSHVGFAVRHLRVATVWGRFTSFAGAVRDTGDGLRVDGHVDTASVDTGDRIRDDRLRTGFFDAPRHPRIEFGARCSAPAAGEEWLVAGTLGVRGAVRPLILRAAAEPLDDGAVRVTLEGAISRTEFGLDWPALREAGRLLVADRVRIVAGIVLAPDA